MATIGHAVLPIIAWLQFRLGWLSFASALFFAFLPDADILLGYAFRGSLFALHRQFTHSLVFALLPLALFMILKKDFLFWGFFGAISHLLTDLLDTHAIPLFAPVSYQPFSLGLWPSTSPEDLLRLLAPDSFVSDKLLLGILILYLAYYFASRWRYDSFKQGRGKAPKKGRH